MVGHGFGWTPGVGDGQGGLACCGSWGRKESDMTDWVTKSQSLLKPMSIKSVMPLNHLILCLPFSSCLQSFRESGCFSMSQFFTSGGRSIGVSASASVLPMNIQDWFCLGFTGWISLQSNGLSRVFSNNTVQKHQFFSTQLSLEPNSHIYTNHSFDYMDICWQSNVCFLMCCLGWS